MEWHPLASGAVTTWTEGRGANHRARSWPRSPPGPARAAGAAPTNGAGAPTAHVRRHPKTSTERPKGPGLSGSSGLAEPVRKELNDVCPTLSSVPSHGCSNSSALADQDVTPLDTSPSTRLPLLFISVR